MKTSKQFLVLVLSVSGLMLSSCGNKTTQAEKTQEAPLRTGVVVVNVLDKKLYDDCHIKDSINVPVEEVAQIEKTVDKDAQVVLYCSNYLCSSSDYVARKLKTAGFKNVAVYAGGTAEWFQKGLPVEGPHESAYLTTPVEAVVEQPEDGITIVTADELAAKMGIAFAATTEAITHVAQAEQIEIIDECK